MADTITGLIRKGTISELKIALDVPQSYRLRLHGINSAFLIPTKLQLRRGFKVGDVVEVSYISNPAGQDLLIGLKADGNEELLADDLWTATLRGLGFQIVYQGAPVPSGSPLVQAFRMIEEHLVKYLEENPDASRTLYADALQDLLAEPLVKSGYVVEWKGRNKAGASDILAFSTKPGATPAEAWLIECRRKKTGVRVRVEVATAVFGTRKLEGYQHAVVVCTNALQEDGSWESGRKAWSFSMADYLGLTDWLGKHAPPKT